MWQNPQETEEILNGKLHFLCSVFFFKKALYELKASGLQLSFDIFR